MECTAAAGILVACQGAACLDAVDCSPAPLPEEKHLSGRNLEHRQAGAWLGGDSLDFPLNDVNRG